MSKQDLLNNSIVKEVFSQNGLNSRITYYTNPRTNITIETTECYKNGELNTVKTTIFENGVKVETRDLFYKNMCAKPTIISMIVEEFILGKTTTITYYPTGAIRSKVIWLNKCKQSEQIYTEDGSIKMEKIIF